MIPKPMSAILLALLLAAPAIHAQAPQDAQEPQDTKGQVYSWTDASGRTHYGDAASAPPASAKPINVRISRSARQVSSTATAQVDASKPDPSDLTPDQKACQEATRNRDLLADADKKVMKAKVGEQGSTEMTLDERAQALDRAQKQVQMYCKGA